MSDDRPVTLLQFSDPHILSSAEDTLLGVNTDFYWRQTFNKGLNKYPQADLIIVSGDLVQDECNASYQRILDTLLSTAIPSICLPGNHDDYALMEQILNHDNVSCSKQTLFDHWQIIALNSQIIGEASGYLSSSELDFLESMLNRFPGLYTLICVHHHSIPCGSKWMDTMQINNSDTLFKLLKKFPQVKAITSGHIHQVLERTKNGIRVFGTPSTCFQFKPQSQTFALERTAPGYRWLQLYADGKLTSGVERLPTELAELTIKSGGY